MSVRVSELRNGLRVATDTMASVETISVGVYVEIGTRHEHEATNGVAHFLEHMAFKGTTSRSARRIAEEIEAVGGQMNAHTGREQTAYYVKILKEDLALGVDILADILQRSVFDPVEFERERGVILQELGQVEDTPDDLIFDRFQEVAYPDQAIGRPVLGRAEIIKSLPRAALIDFRQRYGAAGMVVAASGRVDHEALVALCERHFADLPAAADVTTAPARYQGGVYRADEDLEQIHLVLGFPGIAYDDPDFYAAAVMSTLLGGGMSSRLFQEVRENRGLCYAISSFSSSLVDGGVFGVYTGTGTRELDELIPVLATELRRAREIAPEDEVRRALAQMKAGLLMSLESTNARMDALASQLLIFGRPIPVAEVAERIEAVGPADVARIARRLFAASPTLAAIGPLEGRDPYARLMETFAVQA